MNSIRLRLRSGLSLIELVCVIAIVGVLATLVTVGVQAARESSRRLKCQSNLHQVGVALQNFLSKNGRFPDGLAYMQADEKPGDSLIQFVALLPELEQSTKQTLPYIDRGTALDLPPPVLSCPSSGPFLGYRFNMGSGVSHRRQRNGLMTLEKGILAAQVTDGLSNTAALSERLSGESEPNGGRLPKNVGIVVMPMVMSEADFVTGCKQQADPYNFSFNPGLDWRVGETWDTQYNHFLTPNPKHWDCVGIRHAILSARSRHSGGVNLLLADGAVKWIASDIDRSTWQALGTIANNDTPGNLE